MIKNSHVQTNRSEARPSSLSTAPQWGASPFIIADGRGYDLLLLLTASIVFVGYALRFFNYVEDDAFIPMRYAQNFWRGEGWVMNPNEHVEGCTSPLHLWYVTLLMRGLAPDQALMFSKYLGLILGLGVLVQTCRLAHSVFPRTGWAGGLAALLVAIRPEFALSMINGLETGLATLFLTSGVVRFLSECQRDSHHRLSAVLFAGAALTRPEMAAAFPILVLLSSARKRKWPDVPSLLAYCLPLCLLSLFRIIFYRDIVPNTFYAKQLPLSTGFHWGWSYIRSFLFPNPAWIILTGAGLVALILSRRAAAWPLFVPLCLHTGFLLRCGGDWMLDDRFLVVILPLCAIVWIGAIRLASLPRPRTEARMIRAGIGTLSAFCALSIGTNVIAHAQAIAATPGIHGIDYVLARHPLLEAWMIGNHDGRLAVGRWIASHAKPGQMVLYSEMGMATVQNPSVRFLDIRGLTDRRIARMSGYQRDCGGIQGEHSWQEKDGPLGRYIRQRRPEWVALLWNVYPPGPARFDQATALYLPTGHFLITIGRRKLTVATWGRRDVVMQSVHEPTRTRNAAGVLSAVRPAGRNDRPPSKAG